MDQNLRIAIQAAVEAGKEILKVYTSDFDFELKSDNSPLTIADRNANNIINEYLTKTNIPIISEENGQIDYSIRREWNTCWIVDPLDGTKEFIKRNGEFTVNIALVEEGKPIQGVLLVPVSGKLYYADVQKKEAFVMAIDLDNFSFDELLKNAKKIKQSKKVEEIRIVGSRSHMNTETIKYVDKLKSNYDKVEVVSIGSSLKFCLVAEGKADIYPRFAPTMEWDTAAAQAICSASGVSVISEETGKELVYNKENLLNSWFICKSNVTL